MTLAIREVNHSSAGHQKRGDAFPSLFRLVSNSSIFERRTLVNDLSNTGAIILSCSGPVGVEVPQWSFRFETHHSACKRNQQSSNSLNFALFVLETKPLVYLFQDDVFRLL